MTTQPTTTATTTNTAALLTDAIHQFDRLVIAVPHSADHARTPCPDYDVTALIAHICAVTDRLAHALAGQSDGSQAVPDWPEARARALIQVDRADPETPITLPFGTMPTHAAYGVLVGELATHGWDLASAIHRTDLLDQSLGTAALDLVIARIPQGPRDGMPFEPVIDVPDTAPPFARLAAWMGRDPAW